MNRLAKLEMYQKMIASKDKYIILMEEEQDRIASWLVRTVGKERALEIGNQILRLLESEPEDKE